MRKRPNGAADSFELLEKEGAIWLQGCFPDGTSGRDVTSTLEEAELFTGRLAIEWPELTDRVLPRLLGALDASLIGMALATPIGFGLVALFFIRRRGLHVDSRTSSGWGSLLAGLVVGLGSYVVVTTAEWALAALGLPQAEQAWIVSLVETGGVGLIGLCIFAVVIGPLGEELFFRRYLFEFLDRATGPGWAFGVSTVLFASIHFNPAGLISYCLTGLALALIYSRTRSLGAAYAAHGSFNALSLAAMIW